MGAGGGGEQDSVLCLAEDPLTIATGVGWGAGGGRGTAECVPGCTLRSTQATVSWALGLLTVATHCGALLLIPSFSQSLL